MPRKKPPIATPASSPPTIRTVAELAGVAVSTVSRVINGGSASKPAQEKVNEAIAVLGFTPSPAAQGLVTRKTATIGLVVTSTRGSWFSEIITGVEEALAATRRSILLASLSLTGLHDVSVVSSWIAERRVDGLIFVRFSKRERALLQAATAAGLPTALLAPDVRASAPVVVTCNNIQAGRLVSEHLSGLGHKRVAFIGGPETSKDTRDRVKGFVDDWNGRNPKPPSCNVQFGSNYFPEAGADYADEFLKLPAKSRPTAVVLASDAMALGFAHRVLEAGLQLPDDVSVAGFNNSPEGALFWPGLTSVAQPSQQMAAQACGALLEHINSGAERAQTKLVHQPTLVARQSTGPAKQLS